MGLNNKKYLDYAGLEKLVDMHAVVPHPVMELTTNEGAYKFAFDEHGHIISKSELTAGDLGLDTAMHFVGKSTTDPLSAAGATCADHTGEYAAGDVCIYQRAGETGYEEYVYTGTAWELLGDASSYALRDEVNAIKITAGHHLTGSGVLGDGEITLSHAGFGTAKETNVIKSIDIDECGHVRSNSEITVQSGGGSVHNHDTSTTIAANTYVIDVTDTHTKLSITPTTAKVLTGIEDKLANLDTTSITGVSGHTEASKATAQAAKDVAKAGNAVKYGTANVGTEVTGLAKRAASKTTVGNANVATAATIIGNADVGAATRYGTANVGEAVTFTVGTADVGAQTTVATKASTATTIGNANVASAQTVAGNADVGAPTVYGKANVGEAVKYGTANVGSAVEVATRASTQTTVGNANVATAATNVGNADVGAAVVYGTADVGTEVTVDAGQADVGEAVVYGTANVGTAVEVTTIATADSTFLTGVTASAPTTTIDEGRTGGYNAANQDVYNAYVEEAEETLVLSPVSFNFTASTTAPTLTPTTGKVRGVGGTVSITPAISAPATQTLTPAKASNRTVSFTPAKAADTTRTLTPAVKSNTSIYGAVSSETKIYAVGGVTDITPAVESNTTLTPAVAAPSSQTLTPAAMSETKIYGAVASNNTIYGVDGEVTVTSAKTATGTQTIVPAVEAPAGQTLTPATAATATIYGAVESTTEIYGVTADQVSIKPAVEAPATQTIVPAVANGTITPYTFESITVPVAAEAAITVATGSVSVGGAGAAIMTGTETTDIDVMTDATIVAGTTGDVDVVDEVTATKNAAAAFAGTTGSHTCPAHSHILTTA